MSTSATGPIAVAAITRSTGELHCLLPILKLAKDAHPELRIVVVFVLRSTRARLAEDRVYSAMLEDLGAKLVHIRDLPRYVLPHRRDVRLVFKDFGRTPSNSVPSLLKRACPNASLVLFPHAYALYASGQDAPAAESNSTSAHYDQQAIDALLLNSQLDVESWSKLLPGMETHVTGATGYTDWWGATLRRYARPHLERIQADAAGKKIVLLTTRAPHHVYLTEENYRYLVQHAVEVILSRPDTLIILKPHPRENVERLEALLAGFPKERVKLSAMNTLVLASIATVTVSFWSSAVLDSVAAGTPAIEFYRFHQPMNQLVLDADGRIASIYTTLGLALRADSEATLSDALETALSDRAGLLARQRAALFRCFPDNEERLDTLRGLFDELLRGRTRRTSRAAAAVSMLRISVAAARDLLEELRKRGDDDD